MASDENHKPPYNDELDDEEEDSEGLGINNNKTNLNDDVLDLEEEEEEEELEEEEEEEEEDDDVLEEDELEDEEFHSDPTTSVTIAIPPPISQPEEKIIDLPVPQIEKKSQPLDESRKLFQRLWTDEDEIELLQGFLDYTTARGNISSSTGGNSQHHHYDTALFYDRIKSKLQLDFNKNQLVEKLRRLKKKYRNVLNRISSGKDFAFKTPHDQATFEISKKIWSNINNSGNNKDVDEEDTHANNANNSTNVANRSPNFNLNNVNSSGAGFGYGGDGVDEKKGSSRSRKRSRVKIEEKGVVTDERVSLGVSGMVEETLRSCLSPLFKELLSNAMNGPCGVRGFVGGGMGMLSPLPLSFGNSGNLLGREAVDEKWRKQQIMELEVYSKRLELVQDQIKAALDELRSAGS